MKILVACEESQAVTKAFRAKGHEAFSADLLAPSGGHPEWHFQGDVLRVLKLKWDMILAFPPCTDLASSGARHFAKKIADGRQQRSIAFFMKFANSRCPKVCIENPVGIMSRVWRKPDQIIQPYQFGDPESKKTCLWLKGLPKLVPTDVLPLPASGHWQNQTPGKQNKIMVDGKWIAYGDPRTAALRSKTYPGIAKAMADQWG